MDSNLLKPQDGYKTDLLLEQEAERQFKYSVTHSHIDPKEVNVHQFYPVLDHNFHSRPSIKTQTDTDSQQLAIEDGPIDQCLVSTQDANQVLQNDDADRGDDIETTSSPVCENLDGGVFPTAVDEESLEAARQRSTGLFDNENWQGQPLTRKFGLLRIVTDRAEEHYQAALECKELKNAVSVIALMNKAITLKPNECKFYVERAEAYLQLCDIQSAVLNYKKICLLDANNTEYYNRLAFLYYFQGQTLFDQELYSEALESFSRAAEMVPSNIGYHTRSISCLAALGRHNECLALVNERLQSDNHNPDLYILRARLHKKFRNLSLCYYDIQDSLNLDPDHSEGQKMMKEVTSQANSNKVQAMQFNILGKYRQAMQKISVAIETNPTIADYHVLRGALHRKLSDFNSAIDDFLLAMDKCEHDETSSVYANSQRQLLLTYNDFAVECFQKGFYEEAIILLNKAIKGEKNEKALYVNRGDCFFKQDELHFALQDYHQALELTPNYHSVDQSIKTRISIIHNEFGISLYADKKYKEAETKLSLAIEFQPMTGQFYISRSRTRYMLEDIQGAREDLLFGILLDPTNQEAISILSRLFPGKSLADVMQSQIAQAAQSKLQQLVEKNTLASRPALRKSTHDVTDGMSYLTTPDFNTVRPDDDENTKPTSASTSVMTRQGYPSTTREDTFYSMCLSERDFLIKQAEEKKKVGDRVKDALHSRKSLRYTGGRVQALPPPSTSTRYGGTQGPRRLLISAGSHKQPNKSTNWKTFSLGLGGLANV